MLFIPVRNFKVKTSLPPNEVRARLAKAMEPLPPVEQIQKAVKGEWVDGRMEGDRFLLSVGKYGIDDAARLVSPILFGRILPLPTGSELRLSMRATKKVLWLFTFFYLVVLSSLFVSIHRGNTAGIIYPAISMFLVFIIYTVRYGKEAARYKAFLEELV